MTDSPRSPSQADAPVVPPVVNHPVPNGLPPSLEHATVLKELVELDGQLDRDLVGRALEYCTKAHHHQLRKSGEPYLLHPVEVARTLAGQKLDSATIAAGLLHDVVEDSTTTVENIREAFGPEIAHLVDGVTKITEIQMGSREQRQAETFRKMMLSMARDIRVILIKFADRKHNLQTLRFLSPERIQQVAIETMEVYAPLAHRLGMAQIRSEFEDLSFAYLYPKEYKELTHKIRETKDVRGKYIRELTRPARERLEEEGIKARIQGRPKHLYSIYRKMSQRGLSFDEIYDLFALRIIVPSIRDCYLALGALHSMWNPLPSRFKDYIASPKSNMYQSLHTTLVCSDGKMVEVQIRTEEMHRTAQAGIAAHWIYKEGRRFSPSDEHLAWLSQIEEWQKELTDSNEFLEFLKIDLFPAEVFIFTPKGDIVQLPKGATALDFAFAIHTDMGLYCIGCKVNGKVMPLNTQLKSGSTVDILRSETQQPSMEWFRHVHTSKAKSALRKWLNQEGKVRSRDLGSEMLKREYRKLRPKVSFEDWLQLACHSQKLESTDQLLEMIGQGTLPVFRLLHDLPADQTERRRFPRIRSWVDKMTGGFSASPILVQGGSNLMIRTARCCMPLPGEKIVGFITKGRGVSVHRLNCPNIGILASEKERRVNVEWRVEAGTHFRVRVEIIAKNRPSLLSELTQVISRYHSSVSNAHISTKQDIAHDVFLLEVVHVRQLKKIMSGMERVKGVQKVSRGRMEEQVFQSE